MKDLQTQNETDRSNSEEIKMDINLF
jgi:hypothetical protein